MPFRLPFFFNNYNRFNHFYPPYIPEKKMPYSGTHNNFIEKDKFNNKKDSESSKESSEPFFEIFGFKLYFDDILIICILLFLYNEEVHDDELFICLILLLLT